MKMKERKGKKTGVAYKFYNFNAPYVAEFIPCEYTDCRDQIQRQL